MKQSPQTNVKSAPAMYKHRRHLLSLLNLVQLLFMQ